LTSNRSLALRIVCSLIVSFVFCACLKLHVEPLIPVDDQMQVPLPSRKVSLVITGENVTRIDFARAVTISRIFASHIDNETGSISDLLSAAMKEVFRRKGYETCLEKCPVELKIDFTKALIAWLPPREFIQTPHPQHQGIVRVDLRIETTLGSTRFPDFTYFREVAALPGEEAGVMSLQCRRGLREYLEWLLERL